MIQDIDESVRALIQRDALGGIDVEVVLDAPTSDWAARRSGPTVDLYLYDIRESLGRRRYGYMEWRDDDGHISSRRPWPRVFRLSYLVTAWTQRPEDEHRLLGSVLTCFLRYDALPRELLVGQLATVRESIQVTVAQPPADDRQVTDIWSALGGELKPSLDIRELAPIDSGVVMPAAPLVTGPTATISDPTGRSEVVRKTPRRPQGEPVG